MTTSFQQNNKTSMAVSNGLQILLVTLSFGVLASALDICAFNIQVFGVSKMGKPHVVEKLVDVSVNYLKYRPALIFLVMSSHILSIVLGLTD